MPPTGEFDLIARFRRATAATSRVALGIGDDCAALRFTPGAEILVTTDMLMEGRHFVLDGTPLPTIGRKCLGVNLSDIAAMAGRPVAAVVAVALPRDRASEIGLGLHAGIEAMAREFDVALVGGDTNAWDGPLVVSVTVLGEATGRGPVTRSGARAGDIVLVTGPVGGSLLGRHLDPRPRVREALLLHESADLHAMIDLSDGLASDLPHILQESGGLGAVLDADAIPIHPDARLTSGSDGTSPLDHALADGEDFELCFTVGPEDAVRLVASPPEGVTLHRIGVIDLGSGLRIRHDDGRIEPCQVRGFDHLATRPPDA
jgi:thiamine-monophosphate kinase